MSSAEMQIMGTPQVVQTPYAPELNPTEHFFQALGRLRDGCIRPCKPNRTRWNRRPRLQARFQRGWDWIRKALMVVPATLQRFEIRTQLSTHEVRLALKLNK